MRVKQDGEMHPKRVYCTNNFYHNEKAASAAFFTSTKCMFLGENLIAQML